MNTRWWFQPFFREMISIWGEYFSTRVGWTPQPDKPVRKYLGKQLTHRLQKRHAKTFEPRKKTSVGLGHTGDYTPED